MRLPDRAGHRPPPRTPLLRPDRFFAERDLHALRLLGVVSVLVLLGPVTVYGVGWVVTDHVDGTVLVDNPERPPDWACEDGAPPSVFDEAGCEAPERVERDVDALLRPAVERYAGLATAGVLIAWFLAALALHAGVWLAGGDGGFATSAAVAAWGLVPQLLSGLVGVAALALALDPVVVAPGTDAASALDAVTTQVRAVRPAMAAVAVVTAAWAGVVWRYGLEEEHGLGAPEAWLVAGLVAGLALVLGLPSAA